MPIISTRNLRKQFGTGDVAVEVLRGVDLSIESGEFVALMGPSGSGKSTLLSILGGIEPPSSGEVILDGVDIANLSDDERTLLRRRKIGFVFQAFNLIPTLTALENVSLPLELDGVDAKEAKRRALESLERVELGHRADHIPSKMSGGEQQRVAVARAGRTHREPRFPPKCTRHGTSSQLGRRPQTNHHHGNARCQRCEICISTADVPRWEHRTGPISGRVCSYFSIRPNPRRVRIFVACPTFLGK